MDIKQIEALWAVVETGSFTKAADKLFVTRQAISKSVKKLEDECGVSLLSIQDGRPIPTQDCLGFLDKARPVLTGFSELEMYFSPEEGRLNLAICQGFFETTPDNFGIEFFGPDSGISVQVEETSSETALQMLRNSEVDICLIGSHPKYLEEFEYIDLAHPGYYVCVPLSSPLASKDHLELADLNGQPFVTLGKRNHLHQFFIEQCQKVNVTPTIVAQSSDAHLLKMYTSGPAYSFACAPRHTRPQGATVDIPLGMPDAQIFGTYACRRKNRRLSLTAEHFWDYLLRCHEALMGNLQGEGLKAHI